MLQVRLVLKVSMFFSGRKKLALLKNLHLCFIFCKIKIRTYILLCHIIHYREVLMHIRQAHPLMTQEIVQFFQKYIAENSDLIANREYICPDGTRAAVRRNQILVALDGDVIVAALRFYPKKSTQTISLYQFAVAKNYRGKGVLYTMLQYLSEYPIEVLCPIHASLNTYFSKTGWQHTGQFKGCNRWEWSVGDR